MNEKDKIKLELSESLKELSDKNNADFNKLQVLLNVVADKNILSKRVGIQSTIKNLFEFQ